MTPCPARLNPVFSARPWGSLTLTPFFPEMSALAELHRRSLDDGKRLLLCRWPLRWSEARRRMARNARGVARHAHRSGRTFPSAREIHLSGRQTLHCRFTRTTNTPLAMNRQRGAAARPKCGMPSVRDPAREVMVGLRPDVTLQQLKSAIAGGTAENCLEHVPVSSGDAIFVPAGTAHTIGAGLILCEIQEYSDLTYPRV